MFVGVILIDKNRNIVPLNIWDRIEPDIIALKYVELTCVGVLPLGNDLIRMSVIVSNSSIFHNCSKGRGYERAVCSQILLLFFL